MKLLQFGDLHLGMENFGRVDPATGVHTRLLDFLASLDAIIDIAGTENVDAVLFAGDAYKTRDPSPTVEREFAKRLHALTQAGIPTVLLIGNHDVPNAEGRANTLDVFAALHLPGVYVSRAPETIQLNTKSGPLSVVTLPWVNPSLLLGRLEDRPTEQGLNERVLSALEPIWQANLAKAAASAGPTVGLIHGSVEGAVYDQNTSIFRGSDLPLPKTWFLDKRLDYTAAGHIHRYQVIADTPPIVYAGSPNYIDWSEEGDEKGAILIEIGVSKTRENTEETPMLEVDEAPTTFKHIPIPTRGLKTIQVTLLGDADPTETILKRLETEPLENQIVRLIIEGKREHRKRLDERAIRQALKRAYFSSGIIWDLHTPEEQNKQRELAKRTDEELIKLWCARKQKPAKEEGAFLKLYAELSSEPARH